MQKPKFQLKYFDTNKWKISILFFVLLIILVGFGLFFYRLHQKKDTQGQTANQTNSIEAKEAKKEETVKSKIVCLDPGHGGSDVGAAHSSIYESKVNLQVAQYLEALLTENGYKVYLTRTDDSYVAKRDRSYYCNSINADIMVSIHHNSYADDKSVNYATALYYKDSDKLLASSVLGSTSEVLGLTNQGISKFDNSLLWVANMPAMLSEAFFISNQTSYNSLKTNTTLLKDEAEGLFEGIINYFENPEQIQISTNDNSLYIDRTDLDN